MRDKRYFFGRLAATAVFGLALASTATATASVGSRTAVVVPDASFSAAAAQLASDYGLPLSEATSRVQSQAALFQDAANLTAQLGSANAGAYIDQANGGVLVVMSTDLAATQTMPGTVTAGTRTVPVEYKAATNTLTSLQSTASSVANDAYRLVGGSVAATVDVQHNDVALSQNPMIKVTTKNGPQVKFSSKLSRADRTAALGSIVARTNSESGHRVVTLGRDGLAPFPESTGCNTASQLCYAPLRGGILMYNLGGGGITLCTAGFNVQSDTNPGQHYVLTAGHCVRDLIGYGTAWETHWADSSVHVIGNGQSGWSAWTGGPCTPGGNTSGCAAGDAGIVAVNNSAGWSPGGTVLVQASNTNGRPTTTDDYYGITGVGSSNAIPGGYLCKTGAVSGTTCGAYVAEGLTVAPEVGSVNMALVSLWGCQGDSGSPIYVGHLGYGILSGGPVNLDSHGNPIPYTYNVGININGSNSITVNCGPNVFYTGLGTALGLTGTVLTTS